MRERLGLLLLVISLILKAGELPDPKLTPGKASDAVTQDNIAQTICVPGYTKTIRPPVAYTNKLKRQEMKAMKLPGKSAEYELDHLISLELGGDPKSPFNLWPQPYAGEWNAHVKDKLENDLHGAVCAGSMTLTEAQEQISRDWIALYKKVAAGYGVDKLP